MPVSALLVLLRRQRRSLQRWLIGAIAILTLSGVLLTGSPLSAQDALTPDIESPATPSVLTQPRPPVGNEIDGFPVTLNGEVLFFIRIGVEGTVSAEERAKIISQRIRAIATDASIAVEDIRAETQNNLVIVQAGDTTLFTIRESDANAYDQTQQELADSSIDSIRANIAQYRSERSIRRLVMSIVATLISTLILMLVLRGVFFVASKLLTRIRAARQAQALGIHIRHFQILGSRPTSYLLSELVRIGRVALLVGAFYLYILFVLSQFPATRALGDSLLQDIAYRVNLMVQSFVAYLPRLGVIGLIAIATYYLIGLVEQIIHELGREDVYPWFYDEWVQPTTRLATFLLVAIACVVSAPYLPGFGSPAFQGISIFLGALVTLGSSSAVANAVSGIILIYTRAFQLGDFIRIAEISGTVTEKSLFVTRLMTPKKEIITIPNLSVLNSNVTNYSANCREANSYLVLYTTVTLGYDVPWRDVHEVLIHAARDTKHIVPDPAPFVLQTALNDFNVSYELNAYTDAPEQMPRIYSDLHQNIQDWCNQAGIEILSPSFSALRDGNGSTIPADYLPADYRPPAFQVQHSQDA